MVFVGRKSSVELPPVHAHECVHWLELAGVVAQLKFMVGFRGVLIVPPRWRDGCRF